METKSSLTISQLSYELDAGEAIIKFITKRFKKWISVTEQAGQKYYSPNSIVTMIFLVNKINMGILPSVIEKELEKESSQTILSDENLYFNKKLDLLERKVKALEKKAETQEVNALANKKSIETEVLKIEALNNIASAISKIKPNIPIDFDSNQILETIKSNDIPVSIDTEKINCDESIDDLSMLIDQKVIKENNVKTKHQEQVDDLSLLLDIKQSSPKTIDDLSILIADTKSDKEDSNDVEIDNLALLIDEKQDNLVEIDDLSALIEDNVQSNTDIDDLSILIAESESNDHSIDDLSTLIDFKSKAKPKIKKLEFSPKDDFEKYKSEIINIIIDLKDQGSTEEETCEQFNKEGVLTLSGKTKWSVKMISQIYQLIENAA